MYKKSLGNWLRYVITALAIVLAICDIFERANRELFLFRLGDGSNKGNSDILIRRPEIPNREILIGKFCPK